MVAGHQLSFFKQRWDTGQPGLATAGILAGGIVEGQIWRSASRCTSPANLVL